jgi:plasmid maintenance system antidote protein VapI
MIARAVKALAQALQLRPQTLHEIVIGHRRVPLECRAELQRRLAAVKSGHRKVRTGRWTQNEDQA